MKPNSLHRGSLLLAAGIAPLIAQTALAQPGAQVTANTYNPAISLILDGRYAAYSQDSEEYAVSGVPLGGEAGLSEPGFALSEAEIAMSSNIDDWFYGSVTAALHSHEGATEVEIEEAFIETTSLGAGFTVKAGRFFSGFGYLNEQHPHSWDFADTALVYRALLGNQLGDSGVQLRWVAPTELFVELGAEVLRGESFPAGGAAHDGAGASTAFVRLGGDLGDSQSWRLGASHYVADVAGRATAGGHAHDGEAAGAVFDGDVRVIGVDVVWKWAPGGNAAQRNLKVQAEYLRRVEDGTVAVDGGAEASAYDGTQNGWYAQAVYQFMPQWRVAARYDALRSDNRGDDDAVLEEAGLHSDGHDPTRGSIALDYSHSEYSRLRLQFNRDQSRPDETDNQWFVQYIVSLGAHGAHKF